MEPKSRRVRVVKILGVLIVAIGLAVAGFAVWIRSVADRRWVALGDTMLSLAAEGRSRDGTRPPLRGEQIPGNAWEDYVLALADFESYKGEIPILRSFAANDRAAVERIVAARATGLESLRRGVRRSDGQFAYHWDEPEGPKGPPGRPQHLGDLAVSGAWLLFEDGRTKEAIELLLDTCQFARDLGFNARWVSVVHSQTVFGTAFGRLKWMLCSRKVPKLECEEVARELAILERGLPRPGDAFLNDTAQFGFGILQGDWSSLSLSPRHLAGNWKFGWSTRLMIADGIDRRVALVRHARHAYGVSAAEACKAYEEVLKAAQSDGNPVTLSVTGPSLDYEGFWFRSLAQLRLLRAAAHYLATGDILFLDDPYGGVFLNSVSGAKLKVWSGALGMDLAIEVER